MSAEVLLLVMTDGRRDCILRTIASAEENLPADQGWWPIGRRVIHDDSADPQYRAWLDEQFPGWEIISTPGRSGFGGAIRSAWRYLNATADHDDCSYVLHLEDDFTFNRKVDLRAMVAVLHQHPYLVQLALRRQPWNDVELAAGGVVECHPGEYHERRFGAATWLEHRLFFTTNPSVYRRGLCWSEWPDGDKSEGRFSRDLLDLSPQIRFGYWGARDSGEWVHHIGAQRAGIGY